jgi:hypothetical protein
MQASSPIAVRTMTSGNMSAVSVFILQVLLTGVLAILGEHLVDLVANLALGNLDVVLGGAVIGHEGEETIVGNVELENTLAMTCLSSFIGYSQAGTPDGGRWGRSCCGWRGRAPQASCW